MANSDCIEIPLSNHPEPAIVDAGFEHLLRRSWRASFKKSGDVFAVTSGRGNEYYLHREIMGVVEGEIVDHINGDPLNNTKKNLRVCSHKQNMRNRKVHKNNKLGVKGVYVDKLSGKFRAEIKAENVKYRLGSFETVVEAKAAYDAAAARLHRDFARLD